MTPAVELTTASGFRGTGSAISFHFRLGRTEASIMFWHLRYYITMPFKTSAGSIFATALAFGGGGLGVLLTRGQATWVPQNHWLAPGLFSAAGVLTLWSVLLVLKSSSRVPSDPGRVGQTMGQPEVHGVGNAALAAGRDIHISYSTPVRAVPLHPGAIKFQKPLRKPKAQIFNMSRQRRNAFS